MFDQKSQIESKIDPELVYVATIDTEISTKYMILLLSDSVTFNCFLFIILKSSRTEYQQ